MVSHTWPRSLDRVRPRLTRSDPDGFLHRQHENFSVSDLVGIGRFADFLDHLIGAFVIHHNFNFYFWTKY